MLWRLFRSFLFRFDAETVHGVLVHLIAGVGKVCPPLLRWLSGVSSGHTQRVDAFGLRFRNPVGLAAGFDKNADLLPYLPALGFGYVEIGTVTPRPQGGNPRPRLFRDAAKGAVFNRMGFNGLGAAIVAERIRRARPHLPPDFRIGVNLGKNKDTPLENAADDYAAAARPFEGLADYLVVNVSSPNTPGLRSLQSVEGLVPLLRAVRAVIDGWRTPPPLLVKLAPEIDAGAWSELVPALEAEGIAGWIVSNTLAGVWTDGIPGGWSGEPVRLPARAALEQLLARSRLPVISVGGILTGEEGRARLALGAVLVQVYAGWVLSGPRLPRAILYGRG